MKGSLPAIVLLTISVMTISCAYNVAEELYPVDTCDTTNVTYSLTITPILVQNCYECHGGSAQISGIPLEGYTNIKNMVNAGRLIGAIRHEPGFSFMPKDRAPLQECDILKIEKWVASGAPNN